VAQESQNNKNMMLGNYSLLWEEHSQYYWVKHNDRKKEFVVFGHPGYQTPHTVRYSGHIYEVCNFVHD